MTNPKKGETLNLYFLTPQNKNPPQKENMEYYQNDIA